MTPAERATEEAEYRDLIRSMRERRVLLDAQEVEHFDADAIETAVDWAARIPNARTGSVEVRPVMAIDLVAVCALSSMA